VHHQVHTTEPANRPALCACGSCDATSSMWSSRLRSLCSAQLTRAAYGGTVREVIFDH